MSYSNHLTIILHLFILCSCFREDDLPCCKGQPPLLEALIQLLHSLYQSASWSQWTTSSNFQLLFTQLFLSSLRTSLPSQIAFIFFLRFSLVLVLYHRFPPFLNLSPSQRALLTPKNEKTSLKPTNTSKNLTLRTKFHTCGLQPLQRSRRN